MKCINCGSEIPDDSVKCPDCGANLQKSYETSVPKTESLTYEALGDRKKFYLKSGPMLIWIIALGVSLVLGLIDSAVLHYTTYDNLSDIAVILLIGLPLVMVDLVITSFYASRAQKAVKAGNSVKAWKHVERMMIAFIVLQAFHLFFYVAANAANGDSAAMLVTACLTAAVGVAGAVYGRIQAADIGNKIESVKHDELAARTAQINGWTGKQGMIEENDVKPVNQAAQIGRVLVFLAVLGLFCAFFATEHVTAALAVLAVGAALLIAAIVKSTMDKSKWKQQGLYQERQGAYFMQRHKIIMKKTDFDEVIEQIKKSDFRNARTHWVTRHAGSIRFTGWNNNFEAVLEEAPADRNTDGQTVLIFHFEHFRRMKSVGLNLTGMIAAAIENKINDKTYRDIRNYEVYMNLCMTQVEQAIYRADPNAQIQPETGA